MDRNRRFLTFIQISYLLYPSLHCNEMQRYRFITSVSPHRLPVTLHRHYTMTCPLFLLNLLCFRLKRIKFRHRYVRRKILYFSELSKSTSIVSPVRIVRMCSTDEMYGRRCGTHYSSGSCSTVPRVIVCSTLKIVRNTLSSDLPRRRLSPRERVPISRHNHH